ncbi:unnamed protein product [Allacma fusca]|uniref:Uncharacterized protein n=1 Tax=Allacma fusca TaxID=39272 RepID=A0A8J2LIE4_9HEXA|nr:unnamed protein product [Allacma fusca]
MQSDIADDRCLLPFANTTRKSIRPQDNKDFMKERRKSIYPREFVTHPIVLVGARIIIYAFIIQTIWNFKFRCYFSRIISWVLRQLIQHHSGMIPFLVQIFVHGDNFLLGVFMSSKPQVSPQPQPGHHRTILSMVPLPRVIEACAVLNAKTAQNCLAAVQLHDQEALKRSDIEADVAAMNDKLDIVATGKRGINKSYNSMISSGGHSHVTTVDNADCEQDEQGTSTGKMLFLTVKHDGEDKNLYLSRCARDVLLGCRKIERLFDVYFSISVPSRSFDNRAPTPKDNSRICTLSLQKHSFEAIPSQSEVKGNYKRRWNN